MAIRDKYRFDSDIGTLSPTNSELVFEWRKEGEDGFFVKHLASDLRLQNIAKNGVFDFDKLYTKVRDREICEPINIEITIISTEGSTARYDGCNNAIVVSDVLTRCGTG